MERVFGYGSLIWNPGFPFAQQALARLDGYHRAFCRYSVRHRGTPEAPGMVAGLEEGGSCRGMCYWIDPAEREAALAYLDEREGPGYSRELRPLWIEDAGRTEEAWVYLPVKTHPTYVHNLARDEIVRIMATARGASGAAYDYLAELVRHLDEFGIDEPELRAILAMVERRRAELRDA